MEFIWLFKGAFVLQDARGRKKHRERGWKKHCDIS